MYILAPSRIGGEEYAEFIEAFMQAVHVADTLIHSKDFKRTLCRSLERYKDRYCCFNDDNS